MKQYPADLRDRRCRAAARSFDNLVAATGEAIDAVTEADARGFFAHYGFPFP